MIYLANRRINITIFPIFLFRYGSATQRTSMKHEEYEIPVSTLPKIPPTLPPLRSAVNDTDTHYYSEPRFTAQTYTNRY